MARMRETGNQGGEGEPGRERLSSKGWDEHVQQKNTAEGKKAGGRLC